MGIPFHSYFGAIVALQLGSLVGVLWLTANQYHIQYQLWQLQSQFEIPGELSVEPKRANRVASGSGDPSGGPDSEAVVGSDSFLVSFSGLQLLTGLVLTLLGLLVLGYLLVHCERTRETSLPLSPKAQRELAEAAS